MSVNDREEYPRRVCFSLIVVVVVLLVAVMLLSSRAASAAESCCCQSNVTVVANCAPRMTPPARINTQRNTSPPRAIPAPQYHAPRAHVIPPPREYVAPPLVVQNYPWLVDFTPSVWCRPKYELVRLPDGNMAGRIGRVCTNGRVSWWAP
jgi:hypothetical protein